jgi:hypothetical protein
MQIIADTIIDIAKMFTNLCLYIAVTPFLLISAAPSTSSTEPMPNL